MTRPEFYRAAPTAKLIRMRDSLRKITAQGLGDLNRFAHVIEAMSYERKLREARMRLAAICVVLTERGIKDERPAFNIDGDQLNA